MVYKAINRFNNIKEIRKVCSQCHPEGKELKMTFSKIDSLKELGKNILERMVEDETKMTAFNAISAELTTIHRNIIHTSVFKSWCNV